MKERLRHRPSRRTARPKEAGIDLPESIGKGIRSLVDRIMQDFRSLEAHRKNIRRMVHDAIDEDLLIAALYHCNGDQSAAAKFLFMPRRTLVYLLGQHGLRKKDALVK